MRELHGTGVALITPFNEDNHIDAEALTKLVEDQVNNGVDYLVVLGTTAETATLSKAEKAEVKRLVLKVNKGRLPVVLGIGGNHTAALVDQLKTEDLSGITAILSVSPYYNKPSQEGLLAHFGALAAASPLPIIMYNVPPRTGSNMLPETVLELAKRHKNIIGIKEASGDFEQGLELIHKSRPEFLVISGEDKLALPLVLAGGNGVISVIGQGLPRNFSHMIRLGLKGQAHKAFDLFYDMVESMDLIFEEGNPAGIKCLLARKGMIQNNLRLPLVAASSELDQKIHKFVSQYKF